MHTGGLGARAQSADLERVFYRFAFGFLGEGTFGNSPRRMLRREGPHNVGFALRTNARITERMAAQVPARCLSPLKPRSSARARWTR